MGTLLAVTATNCAVDIHTALARAIDALNDDGRALLLTVARRLLRRQPHAERVEYDHFGPTTDLATPTRRPGGAERAG